MMLSQATKSDGDPTGAIESIPQGLGEPGFRKRLEMLVGRQAFTDHAIQDLFKHPQLKVSPGQLLIDFCEFNRHAASNVLRLSADLLEIATHATDSSLRPFGASTSAIAGLVLRAAADDELGTARHDFMDPHDALMSFMVSALKEREPTLIAREFSAAALLESDRLYRGADARGSEAERLCQRLGAHLASEYSASEEFAGLTRMLHEDFRELETKLRDTVHPQWRGINGMTWISCHEEVEIGHARFALGAAELAVQSVVTDVSTGRLTAAVRDGFGDFYRMRKIFFERLFS